MVYVNGTDGGTAKELDPAVVVIDVLEIWAVPKVYPVDYVIRRAC